MGQLRASMRKICEVLRLQFELGWGQRQVARATGLGASTVHEYVVRCQAGGVGKATPFL